MPPLVFCLFSPFIFAPPPLSPWSTSCRNSVVRVRRDLHAPHLFSVFFPSLFSLLLLSLRGRLAAGRRGQGQARLTCPHFYCFLLLFFLPRSSSLCVVDLLQNSVVRVKLNMPPLFLFLSFFLSFFFLPRPSSLRGRLAAETASSGWGET